VGSVRGTPSRARTIRACRARTIRLGPDMKGKVFRILRWVLIVLVCALIVAQFYRPAKTNPASDASQAIESRLQVAPPVAAVFARSCNDCHSNKTHWPWYSQVAPVSWLLVSDVDEGRQNMNLSEWNRYTRTESDALLKRICREVKSGGMPLAIYKPLHPSARLSADDVNTLCNWTEAERTRIATP
jgi:Haem-binding domain